MNQIVYVIGTVGGGPIKIGVSNNADLRLNALQVGSARPLKVLTRYDAEADGISAVKMEGMIHERLAGYRLSGEWFDAPFHIYCHAFRVVSRRLLKPAVYARWHRRFGRYDRMVRRLSRARLPA